MKNFETRLHALRALRDEIRTTAEVRAMVPGAGPDPMLLAQVERWSQRLQAARNQIDQGHNLNALIHARARIQRNRFARVSAGQRFDSEARNLKALYHVTTEIAFQLTRLVQQKGAPAPDQAKALEAIGKSLKKILEAANTDAAILHTGGLGSETATITASVRQLERGGGGPPGPTTALPVIDMFTLILAYFAFLKTVRRQA